MNNQRRKSSELWNFFTAISKDSARCNLCKSSLSYKGTVSNLKKHLQRKHPTVNLNELLRVQHDVQSVETPLVSEDTPVFLDVGLAVVGVDGPLVALASTNESSTSGNGIAGNLNLPSTSFNSLTSVTSGTGKRVRPVTKQSSLTSYVPKKLGTSDKNKIDKAILKMIVWDFQPFSMVDDRGFRNLMSTVYPNYKIPSRKFFANTLLPAVFEETSVNLKLTVKEEALSVCITTDAWSSSINDSYIATTGHYIDKDFNLKTVLLECSVFKESHTSENLAKQLKDVVDEWEITAKVSIVVSDNASNITSAITKCLKWNHFGCYAHKLNLIVHDALNSDEIQTIIKRVKVIVSYFKKSNVAVQNLLKYQEQNGIKEPKRLLQDVGNKMEFHILHAGEICIT